MEDCSKFDNVVLLVRLDAADEKTDTPEKVQALIDEAKRRRLLVSIPISPNSQICREEFSLSSLSMKELNAICSLVTHPTHKSYMGLQDAVLKEGEERKPTKAKHGDRIYSSREKWAKIDGIEQGVVLAGSLAPMQIQDLEPSPDHGRHCWIVNPGAKPVTR